MSHTEKSENLNEAISLAANVILSGGIGGIPTETVYGLAADALNPEAVRKIFAAKGRPFIDPLICHVCDMSMARSIAFFTRDAELLAQKFWPGPLTLILKRKPCVSDIVTAGLETVAVRMPSHKVTAELIRKCGRPLAAPSANPFGYVSPTCAEHVREQLGDKIDFVLDGGECSRGVESTIVSLSEDSRSAGKILRFGPIAPEELVAALGRALDCNPKVNEARPTAPGMLKTHYSPRSPLFLFDSPEQVEGLKSNIIFMRRPENPLSNHYWLSENGDLETAARSLFSLLRRLDKVSPGGFYCQRAPERGIGLAINDRLFRAGKPMQGSV